jgi:putative phage-type endonuclease
MFRHQETLSVDGVLDKLLHKTNAFASVSSYAPSSYALEYIANVINAAFSFQVMSSSYVHNRIEKVKSYQKQLGMLKEHPVVEQRSEAWHNMRKNMVTASDFAQALGEGKFGTQKQFFQKKCGFEVEQFNSNIPPLKWGIMFESVAADIYKSRNHVELYEFGLIPHPTLGYFGASPDGISSHGIMLEIKCPYKRKITGEIPVQYYYQIQGQLDVCQLEECDYLECEFVEYPSQGEFVDDVEHPYEKGIIVEYNNGINDVPAYKYSSLVKGMDKGIVTDVAAVQSLMNWHDQEVSKTNGYVTSHFWKLQIFNIVRVYRNQDFVEEKLELLGHVWDKVKEYQSDKELYTREVGAKRQAKAKANANALAGYSFLPD